MTIVCVFAHPDDEAFGPGGTIAKLSKENNVYIICVTDGDAKQKTRLAEKKLGSVRKKELLSSAKVLGVKQVYFLGYKDGELCNNLYHKIADKLSLCFNKLKPQMLMTFEKRGVSGHLDHIAVSMITTFLFEKLSFIKLIWYFCNSEQLTESIDNYFVHFPCGYKKEELDQIIDIRNYWDIKIEAMNKHKSQKHDLEWWLSILNKLPKEECFQVIEK